MLGERDTRGDLRHALLNPKTLLGLRETDILAEGARRMGEDREVWER